MGLLDMRTKEYDLHSEYVRESFKLHGQECKIYFKKNMKLDKTIGELFEYYEPINSYVQFLDYPLDSKLKNKKYWNKEPSESIDVYVAHPKLEDLTPVLGDADVDYEDAVISIEPRYYNESSKFIVYHQYGQHESIYRRLKLVPYRESTRTDMTTPLDEKGDKVIESTEGVKINKPYLKR